MENFNKVLSFVLGLVVVIVFVIVLSGRLNLRSGILGDRSQPKVTATVTPTPTQGEKRSFFSRLFSRRATPTPTQTVKVSPTPIVIGQNNQPVPTTQTPTQTKGGVQTEKVTEIPATGLPSLILPLFGSSALLGIYLRKRK